MTIPTLIPLTHLGLLKVSGPDAASFLQGQLSSDIRLLTPNTHQLAVFCNRQGRVLALMDIFSLAEHEYFLVLPLEILQNIRQQLQKYIVFSKAQIEDVSVEYSGIALLNASPTSSAEMICLRSTPDAPVQLWGKQTQIKVYIHEHPHTLGSLNDFLLAQMRAHVPLIGVAQTEQFLPHPLGLVTIGAINFKKGCFVGQEIIARMQYRTTVKKHLQFGECLGRPHSIENIVNMLEFAPDRYALLMIV
ncbi:MAG TPA: hypothetical protein VI522_07535 [Gammaproteobacteria bacterium]|nr:hypothetical protein [Gammaproteobacteria bacterium]